MANKVLRFYDRLPEARTGGTEMSRVEELNQYIQELFDYWDGKNDDFEPIPIPKEVDDEMQRDSFY